MTMKKDRITINRIRKLHPVLVKETLEMYDDICKVLGTAILCRFTQTLRSYEEQELLYTYGRTLKHKSIVTHARGGQSYHNFGLAFDIVLMPPFARENQLVWDLTANFDADREPDWFEVIGIAKENGWSWGGDWNKKDLPHFEKSFGYTVAELDQLVRSGKCIRNIYPILSL